MSYFLFNSTSNYLIVIDGRMDSPGFSVKYYTVMDHESNEIVSMVFINKRLTNLKSTNMEALGFERTMDFLLRQGVNECEGGGNRCPQYYF